MMIRPARWIPCAFRRSASSAVDAARPSKDSPAEPFYLFRSPMVINPARELWRMLLSPIHRFCYQASIEQEYNKESFINGAKTAALLSSILIREGEAEEFPRFMIPSLVDHLQRRLKEIPPEVLHCRLHFEEHQMIHAFIHSSVFSMKHILQRDSKTDTVFHSTFVILIDRNKKSDEHLDGRQTLRSLLKDIDDLLVCNITLARRIIPLGQWRITDLNFFDKALTESVDRFTEI